ncbi:mdmB [Symbiodinium natans]|uniref:MdmB protein n=1 Tax=Symbiodinium natans TaxID=878477 RepID=A0A812S4I3_9DINO|nr:mdmB [Symbiodinium natans]
MGHLNARGQAMDVYACNWGFTWVPWFFMLSGFILCAAEMRHPRQELNDEPLNFPQSVVLG